MKITDEEIKIVIRAVRDFTRLGISWDVALEKVLKLSRRD